MSEAKIMTPLFYDYNFNRQGKKIRAVVDRVVSNGAEVYSLWRRSGRPDYPEAVFDDDMYALSVELNGYLVPIFHTYHSLVRACGEKPAVEKMFGSEAKREVFFDTLGYLLVMFAVGAIFVKEIKGLDDYYVAGRSLGPVVLMATVCATTVGGSAMMGRAGLGYTNGIECV